jgi:hypothetical protein
MATAAALGVAVVVEVVIVLVSLAKHYYNFKVLSIHSQAHGFPSPR